MIERKNIIKLLSDRSNVYHSAFLTTYNFDPIFFESVYLSILRKLGITNVVVLMDASMYDQLVADNNYQYHRVTPNNYTLVRQENTHSGVFPAEKAAVYNAMNLKNIGDIAVRTAEIEKQVEALVDARKVANKIEDEHEKAIAYHDTVAPKLDTVRRQIDKLELLVDDALWPLPKYREMLFIR